MSIKEKCLLPETLGTIPGRILSCLETPRVLGNDDHRNKTY